MTSLARHRSTLARGGSAADRAYEEFSRREAAGEHVDLEAFLREYSPIRAALEPTLKVHRLLEENPYLLAPQPGVCWPAPGEKFLGFHLLSELGRGSFGRVYLAQEMALGQRKVAVKISFRGTVEAATLGRLDHPNIVPVFSLQEDAPTRLAVVCMPYLGKATLEELLTPILAEETPPQDSDLLTLIAADSEAPGQGPIRLPMGTPWNQTVRWLAVQLFEALACMHERGIIHRDLKPSNVLVKPDGTPMLLDFNLAADAFLPELICGGTPDFMAPEQLQKHAKLMPPGPQITAAADVFSMGVILFELLTGHHPFGPFGEPASFKHFALDLVARQQQGPPSVRRLNPAVDCDLANLVESCLAYDPMARPSADAAVGQLRRRPGWLRALPRKARRHPLRSALAALLVASTVALAVGFAVQPSPTAQGAYQDGDYALAVRLAGQVLETSPKDTEALFLRGRAHQRLGDKDAKHFDLAYTDFRDCFEQKADGRYQACMGFCLQRLGQQDNARLCYGNALQLGVDSEELHNNIGYYALKRARFDEAQEHLDKALALNEGVGAVHHLLARLYLQKAHGAQPEKDGAKTAKHACLAKARTHGSRALALNPATTDLLILAGKIHALSAEQDNQFLKQALEYFSKAHEQGADPEVFKSIRSFSALQHNADFENLMNRPRADRTPTAAVLILDPVAD